MLHMNFINIGCDVDDDDDVCDDDDIDDIIYV